MYDLLLSFGLIILAGAGFRRLRLGVDASVLRQGISTSVFNLFLPCLCIKVFSTAQIDVEALLVPATAWITTLLSLIIAITAYTLLGRFVNISSSEKGILIIGAAFGNVTYLGLPIITGVYGYEAAKYALFFDLLATTPLLWIVGASLASKYGEGRGFSIITSLKTIASLPPLWGILVGIAIKSTGITLPGFIMKFLSMLGDLVAPLMIFSIGLALSFPRIRHAYVIIPATIIKLAIVPLIAYATATTLGLKGTALSACILEGAMPTMVLSLLIAARFKLDESLAAFIIVVTTSMSFITLPVAIYLVQYFVR
jgi:predicted permease